MSCSTTWFVTACGSESLKPETRRAVFFDRDGVLNPLVDHPTWGLDSPTRPQDFRLYPDAASTIRQVKDAGFLAVLISNQPGPAKGKYSLDAFQAIDARLRALLDDARASLDGVFYCLHHPQAVMLRFRQACACRKPGIALLLQASRQLGIDLDRSYLIGDTSRDVMVARAALCTPILIKRDGIGAPDPAAPVATVPDLAAAFEFISEKESSHVP
jgi:D-glycero-D-manno-heptose 1,7-bisphosphate phosphatase